MHLSEVKMVRALLSFLLEMEEYLVTIALKESQEQKQSRIRIRSNFLIHRTKLRRKTAVVCLYTSLATSAVLRTTTVDAPVLMEKTGPYVLAHRANVL